MNKYSNYLQLKETNELLFTVLLVLLVLLFLVIARNWYNLYKKRSYKKKNKQLIQQLEIAQRDLDYFDNQLIAIEDVEKKLSRKHTEVFELENKIADYKKDFYATLTEKEREIAQQKEAIHHQQKAYERYVDFKNVEANNTRLGAHFIKNVISQIYEDLENIDKGYKNFLGFQYKIGNRKKKIPPIKALKNIFKLLDYNVSALNSEPISIEKELHHIHMFLELITYLKPNAKITLHNLLRKQEHHKLKIKPTLFFPFVENALKHGSLNDPDSFINIDLKVTDQQRLSYCLTNSTEQELINQVTPMNTNQFGLRSLQQLLDAYYPGNTLEYKALPNKQFMSQLMIPLPQ